MQTSLSNKELIVLEAVEALGGTATSGRLKTLIRRQLRDQIFDLLSGMEARGLLSRYARASYVLTRDGRTTLRTSQSLPLAS
jgi:hypothetical protein